MRKDLELKLEEMYYKAEGIVGEALLREGIQQYFLQKLKEVKTTADLDQLKNDLTNKIFSSANELGIAGIKQEAANKLVVIFNDKMTRAQNFENLFSLIDNKGFKKEKIKTADSSIPAISVTDKDGANVRIISKFSLTTRKGLAFEHLVAYAMNGQVTDKLKDRLDLPKTASDKDVKDLLASDAWKPFLVRALDSKKAIEAKFGGVKEVSVSGGSGGKADLMLKLTKPSKKYKTDVIGISLKLSIEQDNNFIFNKDIGDGTQQGSLISNKEPWWMTGRKMFVAQLLQQGVKIPQPYNPKLTDFNPPDWMLQYKEKYKKVYDAVVSELFTIIVDKLYESLFKMSVDELADIVSMAHTGKKVKDKVIEPLFKLNSKPGGVIDLEEVPQSVPTTEAATTPKEEIVKKIGKRIIIDIPGMPVAVINSIKFRSNMLAGSKSELSIKTR
jgi:hypothetical protein